MVSNKENQLCTLGILGMSHEENSTHKVKSLVVTILTQNRSCHAIPYQRILGNCMLPIWPMTSTVTFRLKP